MSDLTGQTLGAYEVIEKLGEGGMAVVYKGYQPSVDRHVAIKVLSPLLAQDPQFATRFEREARTIASLEHARILPVHDYGDEDGVAYLVMRLLDGGTLREHIAQKGALPLKEAARIVRQVAEGLDYAHGKGVIHRDVTPSNIMLVSAGNAYITDFGIAKLMAGASRYTGTDIIGSPAYLSPEQAMGEALDHRTDIYALGVVLYEMIVGDIPFQAETPMAMIVKHVNEPFPDPVEVKDDLPVAVADVILKATAKAPDDRYQTCLALADALDAAIVATEPLDKRWQPAHEAPAARGRTTAVLSKTTPAEAGGVPSWVLPVSIGGGLLGIGLLVAIVVLLLGGPGRADQSTQGEVIEQEAVASPAEQRPTPLGQGPPGGAAGLPGPVGQPAAGGGPLTPDLSLNLCEDGSQTLFAHDFHADRPEGLNGIGREGTAYVTLNEDWLVISPMQVGRIVPILAGATINDPHVIVKASWPERPGVLAVFAHQSAPGSENYGFLVGENGSFRLMRGLEELAVSGGPDVFDRGTHEVAFSVEDGTLRGSIDGQPVIEAQDPDPLPPGTVMLHAGGAPVYVDVIGVCGSSGAG